MKPYVNKINALKNDHESLMTQKNELATNNEKLKTEISKRSAQNTKVNERIKFLEEAGGPAKIFGSYVKGWVSVIRYLIHYKNRKIHYEASVVLKRRC